MTKVAVEASDTGRSCPYCRFPLKQSTTAERCDACGGLHHEDCWTDGGGCAVFGCANAGAGAPPPPPSVGGPAPTQPPPVGYPPPGAPPDKQVAAPAAAPANLAIPRLPLAGGLPLELWLVIGAFAFPGALLVIMTLKDLPDALEALGSDFFGFRIGLAFLLILLMVGSIGAGMMWIAWRLQQLDRVGRGMAFVFAGAIVLSVLLSDDSTGSETLAVIGAVLGSAILGLSPAVRELFDTDHEDVPTSVVVGRVSLLVFSVFAGFVALVYFLLATFEGKYVVSGLLLAGLLVAVLVTAPRLMTADRQARLVLSVLVGSVVLLVMILGRFSTGLLMPVGFAAVAIACFWLPNDARRFFGDSPIGAPAAGNEPSRP